MVLNKIRISLEIRNFTIKYVSLCLHTKMFITKDVFIANLTQLHTDRFKYNKTTCTFSWNDYNGPALRVPYSDPPVSPSFLPSVRPRYFFRVISSLLFVKSGACVAKRVSLGKDCAVTLDQDDCF